MKAIAIADTNQANAAIAVIGTTLEGVSGLQTSKLHREGRKGREEFDWQAGCRFMTGILSINSQTISRNALPTTFKHCPYFAFFAPSR